MMDEVRHASKGIPPKADLLVPVIVLLWLIQFLSGFC